MATKAKAGGERVFFMAGTQSIKGKTGKEQRTILLRPSKRVADKLGLTAMTDEQISQYRYGVNSKGGAFTRRGNFRGGIEVTVPDPTNSKAKDGPPRSVRAKGNKFLRFHVPGSFTLNDIANILARGGKAKYFAAGSNTFWSVEFCKTKLKAKTLTSAKG